MEFSPNWHRIKKASPRVRPCRRNIVGAGECAESRNLTQKCAGRSSVAQPRMPCRRRLRAVRSALDIGSVDAPQLLGLASITLGLGIAYWLIRERDDRMDTASNTQAE